jgi:hypothetical protein
MKKKYRMSLFMKDIIWVSFWIILGLISWDYKPFIQLFDYMGLVWIIRLFFLVFFFGKLGLIHEKIAENLGVKFKIIREAGGWSFYHVKVLRPKFLLLIWGWVPLDKNIHTVKGQNLFGATIYDYYSTEITYHSEDEAREAIREYKKNSKKELKKYMSKIEKEQKIIIKI